MELEAPFFPAIGVLGCADAALLLVLFLGGWVVAALVVVTFFLGSVVAAPFGTTGVVTGFVLDFTFPGAARFLSTPVAVAC